MTSVKNITQEDFDQIQGKVFVENSSYSVDAYQIIRKTKCFVFVRRVPVKSEYIGTLAGTHEIDWKWVDSTPVDPKEVGEKYTLCKADGHYYLQKGKGSIAQFMGEAERDCVYHTVGR